MTLAGTVSRELCHAPPVTCTPLLHNTGFLIRDDKVVEEEEDVVVDTSVVWKGGYGFAHPAQYRGRACVIKVSGGGDARLVQAVQSCCLGRIHWIYG